MEETLQSHIKCFEKERRKRLEFPVCSRFLQFRRGVENNAIFQAGPTSVNNRSRAKKEGVGRCHFVSTRRTRQSGSDALCQPDGKYLQGRCVSWSNWSELELRLLCVRRRCFDAPICMAGRTLRRRNGQFLKWAPLGTGSGGNDIHLVSRADNALSQVAAHALGHLSSLELETRPEHCRHGHPHGCKEDSAVHLNWICNPCKSCIKKRSFLGRNNFAQKWGLPLSYDMCSHIKQRIAKINY